MLFLFESSGLAIAVELRLRHASVHAGLHGRAATMDAGETGHRRAQLGPHAAQALTVRGKRSNAGARHADVIVRRGPRVIPE